MEAVWRVVAAETLSCILGSKVRVIPTVLGASTNSHRMSGCTASVEDASVGGVLVAAYVAVLCGTCRKGCGLGHRGTVWVRFDLTYLWMRDSDSLQSLDTRDICSESHCPDEEEDHQDHQGITGLPFRSLLFLFNVIVVDYFEVIVALE